MINVAAGIIEKDGKILIAQRHRKDTHGLKWEFPGGTLKKDEHGYDGIVRELFEELNIHVKVVSYLGYYTEPPVHIQYYLLKYLSGDITLHEHEQVEWVQKEKLLEFDLLSGDRIMAEKLRFI